MQSFELQVYKGGKWEFDSYFDDRETALYEAERLHQSDRYNGIRVLKEEYRDSSETSDCSVIFSRLRRAESKNNARMQASREAYRMAVREVTRSDRKAGAGARKARRKGKARPAARPRGPSGSQNHTSIYALMGMALLIVMAGVGLMAGLRYIAHTM